MPRRGRAGCMWRGFAAVLTVAVCSGVSLAVEADTPFGHWTLSGFSEGYLVMRTEHASPRQQPQGSLGLAADGDLHRNVRVHFDMRSIFGGPPVSPDGTDVTNLRDTFQNMSPEIEFDEGYIDLLLPRLDIRLGKQRISWGRLDTFQPTDVINPRRYTDPFVIGATENKIAIPAARFAYYPDRIPDWLAENLTASAVWIPVPFPVRFPLAEERWFPPAATVPPEIEIPAGTFNAMLPAITVDTNFHTQNVAPPQSLDEGGVGLRLEGLTSGIDWSLYYYYGPETTPAFSLATEVSAPRVVGDLLHLHADAALQPRFGHIHMAGADSAFQFSGFTARVEGAFLAGRLWPRSTTQLLSSANIAQSVGPDLEAILAQLFAGQTVPVDLGDLFVRRNGVEWGAGIDYSIDGWTPVLQINQTIVLDNDLSLLLNDVDTRLFAALRKAFFSDRLATEIVGIQGLERSQTVGVARFTYTFTDWLHVRVGYLVLAGTRNSLLGQYKANDEGFVQVRLAF